MTGKIIRLGSKLPTCPLCHKLMEKEYILLRNMFVFACAEDRIAIACDDPMVGKWDAAHEKAGKITCVVCDTVVRFFATSIGYMKVKCPKKKCGATMSNSEPDRIKPAPSTATEEGKA